MVQTRYKLFPGFTTNAGGCDTCGSSKNTDVQSVHPANVTRVGFRNVQTPVAAEKSVAAGEATKIPIVADGNPQEKPKRGRPKSAAHAPYKITESPEAQPDKTKETEIE